jgi:hypothetical protein
MALTALMYKHTIAAFSLIDFLGMARRQRRIDV